MDQTKIKKDYAPVALFVYNRPEHTRQTVEALAKNTLASESDLYVFSDGAKNNDSEKSVKEVRDYIKKISGFKSVTIVERPQNFGLAKSIINGVTEIIEKAGKIIVVEDDLVSSPHFLQFLNDGLDIYEKEEMVAEIHSYIYPIKSPVPETFFIRGADCWGWATWKRAWKFFEPDGQKLYDELVAQKLEKEFNFDNNFDYMKMLRGQIAGRNNSWAIRWYASTFLRNMLTLYPQKPLVKNIGFDGSGTHSEKGSDFRFATPLSERQIEIKKIPTIENSAGRKAFEKYFKSMLPPLHTRLFKKFVHITKLTIKKIMLRFL